MIGPWQRRLPALTSQQRRRFLKAAAATGLLAAVERNLARAQAAPDYKALVCVNLFGGNDGENTLLPFDTAGYAAYAALRPASSGINLAQGNLLPVQPGNVSRPFGFHPACHTFKTLFDRKQLAVVANMGILAAPTTKAALESGAVPKPSNLFSHAEQTAALQASDWRSLGRTGWGGRIADRLDSSNPDSVFPPLTSVKGAKTFTSGLSSIPLSIPESAFFSLNGSAPGQFQFDALRDAALAEILGQSRTNVFDIAAQLYSEEGLSASSVVLPLITNPASVVAPHFANLGSRIAMQLRSVALLIEGRTQTNLKRQVFYTEQDTYDTHGGQLAAHNILLTDLSQALGAFMDSMAALGLSNDVTVFTLSEFGRTLKPAANAGTDHGWGNYAFAVGGAVRGGNIYGTLPTYALGGPDDLDKDGRWIPTTSVEQYGATLARWFGIVESDLPYIFPNIGAFANTNLGFMT